MNYYKFIFYKTYCFFFRMNALNMPGLKTTLILGFIILATTMLVLSTGLNWMGYDVTYRVGERLIKVLVVATQLGLWVAHYHVFWQNGKLPTILQSFEEGTAPIHVPLARVLMALFYLLPVGLFIYNAVRGAQVAHH
jgi:hypothetical protein